MTMEKLVTIFNPKDPTPTATSIRSHNPSEVHLLLIGKDNYSTIQKNSLDRFKSWVSGSMRPTDFPEHIWLSRLDWPSLEESGIRIVYHNLSDITDFDTDILDTNTVVDFLSGTKEMGVSLMSHCQSSYPKPNNLTYTVTQITGSIVDISSGKETEAHSILSIRERIWLSAGKIAKTGRRGSASIGNEVKNWKQDEKHKKIMPRDTDKLAQILDLNKDSNNFNIGYWLESYSSNVIATWPDVVDTWAPLHIIPPSWSQFVAVCFSNKSMDKNLIGYPFDGVNEWPYGFDENGKRNHVSQEKFIQWWNNDQMHFLKNTSLDKNQVEHLWSFAFVNDIDVVALLRNGFYVFVECKHKPLGKTTVTPVSERVSAIATSVAPRSSIPIVVHSTKSDIGAQQGVFFIKWTDLKKPLIGVNTSSQEKVEIFVDEPTNSQNSNVETLDVEVLNRREELIERVGVAVAAELKNSPSTWEKVSMIITKTITKEEKEILTGSIRFKINDAKILLGDYIRITGSGNEAIVEPVQANQDKTSI